MLFRYEQLRLYRTGRTPTIGKKKFCSSLLLPSAWEKEIPTFFFRLKQTSQRIWLPAVLNNLKISGSRLSMGQDPSSKKERSGSWLAQLQINQHYHKWKLHKQNEYRWVQVFQNKKQHYYSSILSNFKRIKTLKFVSSDSNSSSPFSQCAQRKVSTPKNGCRGDNWQRNCCAHFFYFLQFFCPFFCTITLENASNVWKC